MADCWIRRRLTAELLSDARFGSGSGGEGIDEMIARDRKGRPVIWASHLEGVLRDALRRLDGEEAAEKFFGRAGGDYQRGDRQPAVFTSLYAAQTPSRTHIWRSAARQAFDNRAPKDDTLRVVEHVAKGTEFSGEVELPECQLSVLERLVQRVDSLGGGRASGSGRVKLSLGEANLQTREFVREPSGRLLLLLRSRDPLCISATATPDNLIPSLAFVPGRALLGALAAWLIAAQDCDGAKLLTSGRVSVGDALPLPQRPKDLRTVEVLPAPLSLKRRKPKGSAETIPWWAKARSPEERVDGRSPELDGADLQRPEDNLFVYRAGPNDPWIAFRPARRVRLRNGRPDPRQADPSLFAIEQLAEETYFLAELQGCPEHMGTLAQKLGPVLRGERWLRIGRAGRPVEVAEALWCERSGVGDVPEKMLMVLTSDLLLRDEWLRWRTALDEETLRRLLGEEIQIAPTMEQAGVMIYGFNGTSRLWRMPAAAIRRGSVFEISGPGVRKVAQQAANGIWLGERTHEGFGRFWLYAVLPGVTGGASSPGGELKPTPDDEEEAIAETTRKWFKEHKELAETGGGRKPSLSQWQDLVADLDAKGPQAIVSRRSPPTAGEKSWRQKDAKEVLKKLEAVPDQKQAAAYARFFVRWLRAKLRADQEEQRKCRHA